MISSPLRGEEIRVSNPLPLEALNLSTYERERKRNIDFFL
jgi:hypothetical protein